MSTLEDVYEFTQPTQPIEESTQILEDELDKNGNLNSLIGVLVQLNGDNVKNYNLYLNTPILVGRHRTCTINVNSNYTSNRHCIITAVSSPGVEEVLVICEDMSSNGTLWNGKNIGKGNKIVLSHGDTLEIKKGNYITYLQKTRASMKSEEEKELDIKSLYQITDKVLGSGTFAKVKLAICKDTQEQVAVKIMDKRGRLNPGSMGGGTNYIDEINLLRAFDHPNIMRVHDVIETDKKVYIFMPLIQGGDLFDHIISNSSLPEEESKFNTYQILLALSYLHERNISHRDVKPENIMMSSKSSFSIAMLSDFGMARTTDPNSKMNTICGTFQYIAPEIIRTGMEKPDQYRSGYSMAVDCWSLGVVVYAMLSGMLPFSSTDGNDQVLFSQILSGVVDFSPPVWNTISPEGMRFVKKLLNSNPAKRMTVNQAFEDAWIKPYLGDLKILYKRKLEQYLAGSKSLPKAVANEASCPNTSNSEYSSPEASSLKTNKRPLEEPKSPNNRGKPKNNFIVTSVNNDTLDENDKTISSTVLNNRLDAIQLNSNNGNFEVNKMSPPRTPANIRRRAKLRNDN
ncbi:hypothetical protein BB558_003226 [Smittium angustum]|uniref:Uncharacterized protein n=1 Tax=Smittium angustum TaxID=133377 RepID=A0A2U1J6N9_SMIAN|nr:hypothetical protein BB558_003226 [Smittium angustum]